MGTGGSEMGFVAPCPRPMHWRLCGYDWRLARHNSCAHYTANQTKTHTQTNNMDSHQKWIKYFSFDSNNIWTSTVEQVRSSSSSSSSWSKPCWQVVASARTHKNFLNYSYRYFITAPCFNDLFVFDQIRNRPRQHIIFSGHPSLSFGIWFLARNTNNNNLRFGIFNYDRSDKTMMLCDICCCAQCVHCCD